MDADTWEACLVDVDDDREFYEAMYPLVAERLAHLDEIPAKLAFLFWGDSVVLDEKSVQKVLLKEGARADEALAIVAAFSPTTTIRGTPRRSRSSAVPPARRRGSSRSSCSSPCAWPCAATWCRRLCSRP